MKLLGAIVVGAAGLFASAASADMISAFDEKGAKQEIDTANLKGCTMIFDSAGAPFEICKMERVEIRPPSSTRARPGHAARMADVQVVYKKASN